MPPKRRSNLSRTSAEARAVRRRRARETEQKRRLRLFKDSVRNAQRRQRETEKEREIRLFKNRTQASQRRAREALIKKDKRQVRDQEYHAETLQRLREQCERRINIKLELDTEEEEVEDHTIYPSGSVYHYGAVIMVSPARVTAMQGEVTAAEASMATRCVGLEVDSTFNTYEDLKEAIDRFERESFVQLYIRSSRRLEAHKRRAPKKTFKDELQFGEIDYACIHGGRRFKSRSTGQRPNHSTFQMECPFLIRVRVTEDGQKLFVKDLSGEHNHEVNRTLFSHLPQQRKMTAKEKERSRSLLTLKADKKLIQQHIRAESGKAVSLKDLNNVMGPSRSAVGLNLQDVVSELQKSEERTNVDWTEGRHFLKPKHSKFTDCGSQLQTNSDHCEVAYPVRLFRNERFSEHHPKPKTSTSVTYVYV